MCRHETKSCPRCQQVFKCMPDNILQCQCFGIELTVAQKVFIEQRFADCLCRDCLQHLQQELNLFKENIF